MKTNKTAATKTAATETLVDFTPLSDAMLSAWNASATLSDTLSGIWNQHHLTVEVSAFRKQFIAWATSKKMGYSEDWAKHCLIEAGIRVRALRSDAKAARPNKAKSKVDKALAYIKGLKLSHKETVKLLTTLAEA